ncbi:long-chain-fatty-acid--CoA ligase [Cnuibacter physcomitrellae]|uniref:class I adenylate-forming enzyme family protein n=1 Tax=Cnuibacter physcomitrellae TaxID=1619308 RepID=UPI00157C04EB|nr:class I adenylate-forming enzyme family protein [Cnuibacter physcomitrellae]GGI42540.1 long-chain-fatty-acid--CoA ligase [Cnuibacter physcomitrellae]
MNRALPLFDWAFSQADKPAIVTDDGSYSFGQLRDAIVAAAAALADRVAVGTRVGLFIDSTPNFVIHQYAVFYLGGVVVPLNRAMRESEVLDVVDYLGIRVLVSDTPLDLGSSAASGYVVSGEFSVATSTTAAPEMASLDIDDPALILQTSGSTGRPKGVQLSMRNLAVNYDATYRWIGVGRQDVILLTLPIFNTYALNQGINMMAMTGATMRLLRRFSPENVRRALDDSKPTFLPLVPTMLTRLYKEGVRYDERITLGIGAAASPAQIASDAWNVFPNAFLFFGYGLTEGTAIASQNRVGWKDSNNGDFSSAGCVVPGVKVALAPSDEPDGRGEILISGEAVFSSYVGTDEPRPVVDGWLHTGDVGVFTGDRLSIVDRKRELIIRGGQNIYPGEVERLISAHEAVLEAAVVGAADGDLGEVPVAFVVLRNGVSTDGGELLEWLRPRAAAFKLPVAVHVLESMPKTPTGKIRKLDLKEMLASRVVS